jgi:hypothetical protein
MHALGMIFFNNHMEEVSDGPCSVLFVMQHDDNRVSCG